MFRLSSALVLLAACASPRKPVEPVALVEDRDALTVTRDRLATRAALERLPACVSGEWERAATVGDTLDAGREGPVVVTGLLQSGYSECEGRWCGEPLFGRSRREVERLLNGACCDACAASVVLVDSPTDAASDRFRPGPMNPGPGLIVPRADLALPERVTDCAVMAVERDLAQVRLVAWGQLRRRQSAMVLEPDRLCRAALPAFTELRVESTREEFKDLGEALEVVGRELAPGSRSDASLFHAIRQTARAGRPEDALRLAAWFLRERPGSPLEAQVERERASILAMALDVERAAEGLEAAARRGPDTRSLLDDAAHFRAMLGAREPFVVVMRRALEAGQEDWRRPLVDELLTLGRMDEAVEVARGFRPDDRFRASALVEALARAGKPIPADVERALSEPSCMDLWWAAEPRFRALLAAGPGPRDALLEDLTKRYAAVRACGRPWSTVAALWREALALEAAGRAAQAAATWEACVRLASKEDVFSAAALGCRRRSAQVEFPFPTPAELRDVDVWRAGVRVATHRYLGRPKEAGDGALEVARELLRAGRVANASAAAWQLAADDSRLGVVLAYTYVLAGRLELAAARLVEVVARDPKNRIALANLAALRCRAGDVEGARAVLSRLEGPPPVEAPELDPRWKHCGP